MDLCYNDLPAKTKEVINKIGKEVEEKSINILIMPKKANSTILVIACPSNREDAPRMCKLKFLAGEWLRTIKAFGMLSKEIEREMFPLVFGE